MPRKVLRRPSQPPPHPTSLCQKESDTRKRRSREYKRWSRTKLPASARAETFSPDPVLLPRFSLRPTIRQTKKKPTQSQFRAPEPTAKLPDAARHMAQNIRVPSTRNFSQVIQRKNPALILTLTMFTAHNAQIAATAPSFICTGDQ